MLDINLRAPLHLANAAAPYLLSSEAGGQLVLIGSIVGLVGVAEEVAYGAAKYGLRGLADGLRSEWARDIVRPKGDRHSREPRRCRHPVFHPPEPWVPAFVAKAHARRQGGPVNRKFDRAAGARTL